MKLLRGHNCTNNNIPLNVKCAGRGALTSGTAWSGIYEWNCALTLIHTHRERERDARTRARTHTDAKRDTIWQAAKNRDHSVAAWLRNSSLSLSFLSLALSLHLFIQTRTHILPPSPPSPTPLVPTAVCHPARLWRRPYVSHRRTLTVSGPPIAAAERHNSGRWQQGYSATHCVSSDPLLRCSSV